MTRYLYEITWAKQGDRRDDPPMQVEGVDHQIGDGLHRVFARDSHDEWYLALTVRTSDVHMVRVLRELP